ncbi:GNAT family N-acetyltransferase [Streptomyces sp. NPDC002055]|uniref:GNAT family N-acetyltransferase n=1 Tax=Streptomyces sp. NPDC002055 TaxID=3154534 RepID=UPI00331C07CD
MTAPTTARARPGPQVPTGLSVTLCGDPDRFARLAPAWDGLHRRCRSATPFQTHAWLHSWWQSYGTPGRLRLLLVHRDGRLVGAAPLILTYRPMPALTPLGGTLSDFLDVLIDDSCADAAAHALVKGLSQAARAAVVDLREARPGAAAERIFELWPGPRRRREDSLCLELPGVPVEELLRRMPASSARRSRGKLRKLAGLDLEDRTVPEPEVPRAVETMLRLHSLQWQGRGVTPEHLRPRFAAHLLRAVPPMVGAGHALVTEYRLDGHVAAVDVTLTSSGLAGGYLYGAHPDLRAAKADINTMLLRHDADCAARTGRALSLLRGDEAYKHHWRPERVVNQRYLLARRELEPMLRLYAAQVAGRTRLAEEVRTRAPALRAWRTRLNNWRAGGAGPR